MEAKSVPEQKEVIISAAMSGSGKVTAKIDAQPRTVTIKLHVISSRVKQNVNAIIFIIGGMCLIIFVGIMIAVLLITTRGPHKEDKVKEPVVFHDPCVDRERNCYRTQCHQPYIAGKDTTVDNDPCVPAQVPDTQEYASGLCVKEGNMIPSCYTEPKPPFRKKPCYKYCDQPDDCIVEKFTCYRAERRDCSSQFYAYNQEHSRYTSSEFLDSEECGMSKNHSHMPYCILADARAPYCYDKFGSRRFCYAACKAISYKVNHGTTKIAYDGYYNEDKAIVRGKPITNTFYGTNWKDCEMMCNRTYNCYFYNVISNGSGICELLGASIFRKIKSPYGSFGWVSRKDTVVFFGGRRRNKKFDPSTVYPAFIRTLRFEDRRPVWSRFSRVSSIRKQMNPVVTSAKGIFYAISYSVERGSQYIEQFDERGLHKATYKIPKPDIRHGAVVGVDDKLLLCGGLNVSSGIIIPDCEFFIASQPPSTRHYHSKLERNRYHGASKMLLPRDQFFMVKHHGIVFAFMGCQKPPKNCTKMVKPIHYYVIQSGKWQDTGARMKIERINYGYATYKDKVYVCGGLNPADRDEVLDSCEVYHLAVNDHFTVPVANTAMIKELPEKTQGLVMVVCEGRLLAIGGRHTTSESNISKTILRYDDDDNDWTLFATMTWRRYGMGVAVI